MDAIAVLRATATMRRVFYTYNSGPEPVALVGAAGTLANAAIFVQSGEIWRETLAAGVALKLICSASKTATVNIQGWA